MNNGFAQDKPHPASLSVHAASTSTTDLGIEAWTTVVFVNACYLRVLHVETCAQIFTRFHHSLSSRSFPRDLTC
jgi:hypothetical protein